MKMFALALVLIALVHQSPAYAACDESNSRLMAAVVEVDGNIEVWINTREHWQTSGCLTDSYSADEQAEVDAVTDRVKLCNLAESTYEPCLPGRSVERIKSELKAQCVVNDLEFQTWAEGQSR